MRVASSVALVATAPARLPVHLLWCLWPALLAELGGRLLAHDLRQAKVDAHKAKRFRQADNLNIAESLCKGVRRHGRALLRQPADL
jgi:hypothetical protein